MNRIIVDSNIIFSTLLKNNHPFADILCTGSHHFFSVNFAFVEIFKYKDKILKYSQLEESKVLVLLNRITKNINFYRIESIENEQK